MLTDNQRHHVLNLLRHVEHEAQDGIGALEGDDREALFPRYSGYPDPERIRLLRSHLARLRSAMRRFMDAQGIAYAGLETVDASWGFQTRMALARNAVYDLRPSYMRGYGELDAQSEQDCRALAAELGLLLDDITRELRREPLRLPTGQAVDALLATLVEVIERHHLLEFRNAAERLLQGDAEGQCIEVAMLGRVSSGKSSLVNALLEQPLLPVGAIPVTAVVTRIRHGNVLRIQAIDVEGRAEPVEPEALPDYIAESGNQDNHRRLREVRIEVPAPILREEVGLTDTPGLGSLHTRASAHALTYLPQCDLGVLTIDASATLAQQDVDLLRALKQAHASWLVVLTKCDSVAPDALAQQRGYIGRALSEALDEPVPVAEISVAPEHAQALHAWRSERLRPALEACGVRSRERRRQRLGDLARRVCLSLEQALRDAPAGIKAQDAGRRLATLSDTERRLARLCSDLSQLGADTVLRDALPALVNGDADDVRTHVGALAGGLADEVVRDIVAELRRGLDDLSEEMLAASFRGAPPFVPPQLPSIENHLRGPAIWRRCVLQRRLREQAHAVLQQAFQSYAQELRSWLDRVGRSLRQALGSDVLATRAAGGAREAIVQDLERIRSELDGGG